MATPMSQLALDSQSWRSCCSLGWAATCNTGLRGHATDFPLIQIKVTPPVRNWCPAQS